MSRHYYGSGNRKNNNSRFMIAIVAGILAVVVIAIIVEAVSSTSNVQVFNSSSSSASVSDHATVPWDYRVEETQVGDLIGADMTLLPNNQLLPNDDNYATGDKVWLLSYMSADIKTRSDGQNEVTLSQWTPLKTYRNAEAAQQDLAGLKVQLETEVELVGVYKTEYQGSTRQFAMLTLPSGHTIKQPVTEERYNQLKSKKQVRVLLEEVHDFGDYDLAMAKFRGWAE